MADAFKNYQEKLVALSPGQAKVERAFGVEKDTQLDRARQALLVGFPGLAPTDALGYIGSERGLPRVSGETSDDYAERLRTAWDGIGGWSFAGSHGSMLRALERAGFPMGDPAGAHIVQRTKRYSYLNGSTVTFGTHSGMTWDARPPQFWNQFGIIFGADVPGLDPDTAMADLLNRTVRLWKPAKARFMGTWVATTLPLWGWPPSTVWGQASLDWGESAGRFIPPT